MKRILFFLAAMLLSGLAFGASAIFRAGADSVEITEEPCHAAVVPLIPAEIIEHFRAANAVISGKLMKACWALRGDGFVFLYYEDSDQGMVHSSQFQKARQL